VWYGFPIPNSAARLTSGIGGASPGLVAVLGRIKLVPRGGRGLVKSGPDTEGFRCLGGDPLGDRPCSSGHVPLSTFDGLRIPELFAGSEGLRNGGSLGSLGRGNVCDLFSGCNGSRSGSSLVDGGPNPPYPFALGI
jgi:hypothetical protein